MPLKFQVSQTKLTAFQEIDKTKTGCVDSKENYNQLWYKNRIIKYNTKELYCKKK